MPGMEDHYYHVLTGHSSCLSFAPFFDPLRLPDISLQIWNIFVVFEEHLAIETICKRLLSKFKRPFPSFKGMLISLLMFDIADCFLSVEI